MKKGGGHEAEPSSPTCNQLKINSTKLQLLRTLQDRALYKHLTKSSPDKKKNMGKKAWELLVFLFISLVILKVITSTLFCAPCMLWLCRTDKQTNPSSPLPAA